MITMIGSLKGGSGKSTLTFNLAIWLIHANRRVMVVDADPQATLSDVADVRREEGFQPPLEVRGSAALNDRQIMKEFDETLIDVGTADIEAVKRAIGVADRIIVPVPPSQADIWSTQRFIRFVESVASGRSRPEIVGFINRADTHRAIRESDEAAAALVSLPGIHYLKPRLAQRTAYRRSFSEGLAVFELEPRGKGTREWYALAAALYPEVVS
jgi:chromosome partitioning protein